MTYDTSPSATVVVPVAIEYMLLCLIYAGRHDTHQPITCMVDQELTAVPELLLCQEGCKPII